MFPQPTYLQRKELRNTVDTKTIAVSVIDEDNGDMSTASGTWQLYDSSNSLLGSAVTSGLTFLSRNHADFFITYSARSGGNFSAVGDYIAVLDVTYKSLHHSWVVPIRVVGISEQT